MPPFYMYQTMPAVPSTFSQYGAPAIIQIPSNTHTGSTTTQFPGPPKLAYGGTSNYYDNISQVILWAYYLQFFLLTLITQIINLCYVPLFLIDIRHKTTKLAMHLGLKVKIKLVLIQLGLLQTPGLILLATKTT